MVDSAILTKASRLEARISYRFNDIRLLRDAIVLKGFENEVDNAFRKGIRKYDISILANLGDTVIDLLATEYLILKHDIENTGEVTERRQRMVCRNRLTRLGHNFQLDKYLTMSDGERRDIYRSAMLGEAVESLIGAVYLDVADNDSGLDDARNVLTQMDFFSED
ncbi:MAG: hypothetical protein GX369_00670 [Euryarchaeota archaeon]|nr:hypothetical protein [Euryarchaeota archaeon]